MWSQERSMGPVPCRIFGDLWDFLEFLFSISNMRSHVSLLETYRTGPMQTFWRPMGLLGISLFNQKHEVPCMALRDRSHVQLPKTYGTGPMQDFLWPMGPLGKNIWPHVCLEEVHGTSPMYSFKRPMGPVPCMALRNIWDWSHSSIGTSHYNLEIYGF